ncbi:MAG TPA: hypothetical protein VD962_05730 [Rubricoccaceae bacterium]|nr:hypothetical protein [Rubricoccaceae bacterium]
MYRTHSLGWLAALGLAFLASSAMLRRMDRSGSRSDAPYDGTDDLLQRVYA